MSFFLKGKNSKSPEKGENNELNDSERQSSGTTANSTTEADKEQNTYRKSVEKIKQDLFSKIEIMKQTREKIKTINLTIKDELASERILEQEILMKKKELALVNQNIKNFYESLSDSNIQLEKLESSQNLADFKEKVQKMRKNFECKNYENLKLKQKICELISDLEIIHNDSVDKDRYLCNLRQYLKKIKHKGSLLHKTKESQISDLKVSQNYLKNQICEHEKFVS